MHRRILAGAMLCAASAISSSAMAWDDGGHQIVALIADHYMLPPVREKVRAMLAADGDTLTGHDIASAATWADKYRDGDQDTTKIHYNQTYRWHMADISAGRPNVPKACFGQPRLAAGTLASQGPAEACVIDKINQFAAELGDPRLTAAERVIALKYLLNLVGDVHQPLNVVDESDSHGRGLMVAAKFITPGDLYGYWNNAFVTRLGMDPAEVAQQIIKDITPAEQRQWSTSTPQLWALDAHQIGVDRAFGMEYTLDAQGNRTLTDAYVDTAVKTVRTQLGKAGVRLAFVLNEALSPSPAVIKTAPATSGNAVTGKAFADAACSVCHVVGPAQRTANDGALAPDFQAIANTRGMNEVALRGFLFGPHPTMPAMKLTPAQAEDLIAYIRSLRTAR